MADSIDIDAIRQANPLAAIVQPQVRLNRAGNELRWCCPFHNDQTPSFYIFDCGRGWICFGCGAGGDVFDYVQRLHGVGLIEAARMLGAQELPTVAMPTWKSQPKADRRSRHGRKCLAGLFRYSIEAGRNTGRSQSRRDA